MRRTTSPPTEWTAIRSPTLSRRARTLASRTIEQSMKKSYLIRSRVIGASKSIISTRCDERVRKAPTMMVDCAISTATVARKLHSPPTHRPPPHQLPSSRRRTALVECFTTPSRRVQSSREFSSAARKAKDRSLISTSWANRWRVRIRHRPCRPYHRRRQSSSSSLIIVSTTHRTRRRSSRAQSAPIPTRFSYRVRVSSFPCICRESDALATWSTASPRKPTSQRHSRVLNVIENSRQIEVIFRRIGSEVVDNWRAFFESARSISGADSPKKNTDLVIPSSVETHNGRSMRCWWCHRVSQSIQFFAEWKLSTCLRIHLWVSCVIVFGMSRFTVAVAREHCLLHIVVDVRCTRAWRWFRSRSLKSCNAPRYIHFYLAAPQHCWFWKSDMNASMSSVGRYLMEKITSLAC